MILLGCVQLVELGLTEGGAASNKARITIYRLSPARFVNQETRLRRGSGTVSQMSFQSVG